MSTCHSILVAVTCSACAVAGQPDLSADAGPRGSTNPTIDAQDPVIVDSAPSGFDADLQGVDANSSSSCGTSYSGVIATWTFSGQPGSQATTPLGPTASGVTGVGISRSSALTAASGTDTMNASNWGMSAQTDTTKYYALSIAPPSGCMLDLTSI